MEQKHAHEVLHMMQGNSYTKDSLKQEIIENFGEEQRFYACSDDNMNIDDIILFLQKKGKFMPVENNGFTVYISKVCNH